MPQYSYRLTQPNDDYREAVIEKAGITATFTIGEVQAMQERNRKAEKELTGQLEIEKAKMVNIEHFHPEVKKMKTKTLVAAAIYQDSQRMIIEIEPKLKSLSAAIAENDAMVDTVMKQMGFVPTEVTSSPEKHE